jgi:hypothetical protein
MAVNQDVGKKNKKNGSKAWEYLRERQRGKTGLSLDYSPPLD